MNTFHFTKHAAPPCLIQPNLFAVPEPPHCSLSDPLKAHFFPNEAPFSQIYTAQLCPTLHIHLPLLETDWRQPAPQRVIAINSQNAFIYIYIYICI